ncbi:MAG: glycosyltransferase [Rhodocyclaceae bacterium]|nr:glycosyltransferase [Rhodocyclaceae bacterium]
MPTVSVLIPAYKPEHLQLAIASAREQTYQDIEILVGDDTADAKLRPIVEAQAKEDARVKYFHHGFGNGQHNSKALWNLAQGKYVKWLFDDDVLMPGSVESLLLALQSHPGTVMAFHERVYIDTNNNVINTPPALIGAGECALLDRRFLASNMVARRDNFIGEPSNIMIDRTSFDDLDDVYDYQKRRLIYLTDVAMYLNCAEHAPLVLVGGYLSGFRRHPGQASNADSPIVSAGHFEWELLLRGEVSLGNLDKSVLPAAADAFRSIYARFVLRFPELAPLMAGLDELDAMPDDPFGSPDYQKNLAIACAMVWERFHATRKAREADNYCAVCEQSVGAWLPHPELEAAKGLDFLREVQGVGSTLEMHHCPRCQCNDRDRHLWLYMSRTGLLDAIPGKRILHIAPEARLEPRIAALKPAEYIRGDLFPKVPEHQKINVEALDFPDGCFDLIICNHVLEHVDHPETALAEFSRCLSPQGRLIAQTPYSPIMKNTLEMTAPVSTNFKVRYYGQDDHVRLFGADIVDYFKAAGLHGELYPHEVLLGDIDPDRYGVNGKEPFFLFAKGGAPLTQI